MTIDNHTIFKKRVLIVEEDDKQAISGFNSGKGYQHCANAEEAAMEAIRVMTFAYASLEAGYQQANTDSRPI